MTSPTPPRKQPLRADELTGAAWFKSTYSGGEDNCVEVADVRVSHAGIAVRDSKVPNGPALLLPAAAFAALIRRAAHGDYDI